MSEEFDIPVSHLSVLRQAAGIPADGEMNPAIVECYKEYRIISDRLGCGDSIPASTLAMLTYVGIKSSGGTVAAPPPRTLSDRIKAGEVNPGAFLLIEKGAEGLVPAKFLRSESNDIIVVDHDGDEFPMKVEHAFLQGAPDAPASFSG